MAVPDTFRQHEPQAVPNSPAGSPHEDTGMNLDKPPGEVPAEAFRRSHQDHNGGHHSTATSGTTGPLIAKYPSS